MKNGQCPKCHSADVYRGIQSPLQAGEGFVHLVAYSRNTGVNLPVDTYVCRNCGYVEMYVAEGSKSKLEVLAQDNKRWQKVV